MLHREIEQRLRAAVTAVLPDTDTRAVLVRPCPDPKFGDYQSNALMALAKARRMNPRQLATDVVAKLDVADCCEPVEIAGAGFLNFRVKPEAVARALASAVRGEHLFFHKAAPPRTVVIDFSSPNVAKPMHVGHIRSTVLGDCLARVMRLLGHRVVTDNHIGDWGTQFGMLLIGWKRDLDRAMLNTDPIAEMERLYKKVNAECKADPAALDAARAELVKLQAGDAENLAIWRECVKLTLANADTFVPSKPPTTVFVNPPWGERLEPDDDGTALEESWRQLGHFLHGQCRGATAYVLSGNESVTRMLGLRASGRVAVKIGPIDCRLLKYEIEKR